VHHWGSFLRYQHKHTFPFPYTVASGPCSGGNWTLQVRLYQAGSGGLRFQTLSLPRSMSEWTRTWEPARVPESLDHFEVLQCNSTGNNCTTVNDLASSFTPGRPRNNGTGFSDGVISHITLVPGDYYKFEAVWHNDNRWDGAVLDYPRNGFCPRTGHAKPTWRGLARLCRDGSAQTPRLSRLVKKVPIQMSPLGPV